MKKYIILIILMVLLIPSTVKGEEYFKDGGYIGTSYIKKIRSDGSGQYKRMKSILRKSDNKLSYCIAPWSSVDDTAPYRLVNSINEISPNTLERIKLISYYGYGYNNHTDDIWYAVTQLLIWREIDPSSKFYFTGTLNGDYTNKYDNYFNEILDLVNNHNFKLDTKEVTLMVREKYTINITEGNINDFDIIDKNNLIKSIDNNKIEIKPEYNGDFNIIFRRKPIYNESVLLYKSDTSQDMMITGNINDEYIVNIHALYGEVTINKRDKETGINSQGDASLIGTSLILLGPEVGEIVELDETLSYKWDTLPFGFYTVSEYEPNEGYELSKEIFSFNITTSTRKYEFTLNNQVIKNTVHIHKTYNDIWNNYINEEGITFEIYNKDKLYTTCTTNEEGIINIELPYGTYIFHQSNTKEGYTKVDDFEVIIKDSTEVIEYELKNNIKEGTLLIHKYYGNDNSKKIEPNTEFEIYNNDKLYTSVKTNEDGIINIEIPYGTYKLHQVSSKYGYDKINDLEFTINNNNKVIELDLLDKEKLGSLEIYKLYEKDNDFIEEEKAKFEIYKDNKLINTLYTDKSGYLSTKLNYGTYVLHEVITDNRFMELDDITFTIDDSNTNITYNLKDYLKKYELTINKKDLSTNELINTNEIIFLITDSVKNKYEVKTINGIASITLPIEEYSIKEINTNIGYTINEDIITISLDNNKEIDFYNSKIEVPDTNTTYNYSYLLIIGLFILLKKIKKYS